MIDVERDFQYHLLYHALYESSIVSYLELMRLYCVEFDRESLINYRRELIAFSRRDLMARRDYDFRYRHARG